MFEVLKRCFDVNLNDYENINFSLEINKVVVVAFAALMVGIVLLNTYRGSIRTVVMQLTRHGATSEAEAKTLAEIGLDKSKIAKKLLSGDNILTKVVARVGEVKYEYEEYVALTKEERKATEKIDFSSATFYIREDQKDRAANINDRYGTTVLRTLSACLFVVIICVCIIACMPGILNALNQLLGSFKK